MVIWLKISKTTLYSWRSIVRNQGEEAFLSIKKPGRKPGKKRLLTPTQEVELQEIINNNPPFSLVDYDLGSNIWDRKTVLALINQKFNINMCLSTVGLYLKRWGFTPQRPKKRAYEQNKEAVKQFIEHDFPALVARAKKEGAIILFLDETGFSNTSHFGRSYALKGKTPVVVVPNKKLTRNVVITVGMDGKLFFMTYEQNMNSQTYIVFLSRLIQKYDKKIILIADNMKVHHSHMVQDWVKGKEDKIELQFLPSYSPKLNPVEFINSNLKYKVYRLAPCTKQEQLNDRVRDALKNIRNNHETIEKTFEHVFKNYWEIMVILKDYIKKLKKSLEI
jgi:transposase